MALAVRMVAAALIQMTLLGLASCRSAELAAARRADSVDALRAYLARHPGAPAAEAEAVGHRIEALRFREAREADLIVGYRRYLDDYPSGAFAPEARARLQDRRLERARRDGTSAALERYLTLYPEGKEADEVRGLLAEAVFVELAADASPVALRAYLERFPASRRRAEVEVRLRRAELTALRPTGAGGEAGAGPDLVALEGFVGRYAGTAEGAEAEQWLERAWAAQVLAQPTGRDLARFAERFPASARLAELRRAVAAAIMAWAEAELDPVRLDAVAAMVDDARAHPVRVARELRRLIQRRPAHAARVRGLASAAAPFRPASDWPALRIRLASSDLHAVWEALDAAGYLGGDQIAEELFDRVGTGHPSAGLRAACALELSIGRLAPGMRARLLARLGERLRLRANPLDECLRRGLLAELAGDVAGALAGYDRCRASGDGETLAATLATRLSLRARRDDGGQRVHGLAAVLSRQAETASKLFPTPLVPEQSDLGRLAARQLAGVVALAEGVLGSSARRDSAYDEGLSSPLLRVRAEGLARLKDLERQVLEIDPTFVAARERRVAPEAAAHRVARQGAWERLLELARRGDLLGRAAVGGLCRLGAAPVPCASVVGM